VDDGIRAAFRHRFGFDTVNASAGNDDMINIEVVTLNVVQYARATNAQTLQKLSDGSFPSQSKLQSFDTDSCAVDAPRANRGHDHCCCCE